VDLTSGKADVIVTDGFTGNVALKALEGASQATLGAVRAAATSGLRAKLGGLLLRPALRGLPRRGRPRERRRRLPARACARSGSFPTGRFTRYGFSQAILLAARGVRATSSGRTHSALDAAGALREGPRARCRPTRALAWPDP
jgi:glycerol-3-phosphate acyltransferase PlsX